MMSWLGLTDEQLARYARHLVLPAVESAGQQALLESRVLVVGGGGLGSAVAFYLAAAGVGVIGLVDYDSVDLTNLQRQILYRTVDVGRPKTAAAAETLRARNPDVIIAEHHTRLTPGNALDLIAAYDLVIDATDNFPTRYLVNDACVLLDRPLVWGPCCSSAGSYRWCGRGRGRVIAAFSPPRRRPTRYPPALKRACWEQRPA